MGRRLLVTCIDYTKIVLAAGLKNCVEVTAVQRKDFMHVLAFERPYQHFTTVYARHIRFSGAS
jgi:hypothetical protein